KIERAAEPEPRRASADSSVGVRSSPAARVAATASAAKPEADDASPDAVGTLLRVTTRARRSRPARARTRSRNVRTLSRKNASGSPPGKVTRSSPGWSRNSTRVTDDISLSVRDRLPTAGRLSAASRFPQYLQSAMLVPAVAVTARRLAGLELVLMSTPSCQ